MNQKTKIQLSKLTTILVAWLIIALLIGIYDHFAFASDYSLGYSEKYSFLQSMGFHIGAALIASVFGGSFLVFYVDGSVNGLPVYTKGTKTNPITQVMNINTTMNPMQTAAIVNP